MNASCSHWFVKLVSCERKLEVNRLTFVTADSCRPRLERLTQLLISAFPGSTVYQHTELFHVPHDVLNHRVDAVFLEVEKDKPSSLDCMKMLHRQKTDVPVFIVSKNEDFREEAGKAGANGYFVLLDSEQQLLDAIRLVKMRRTHPVD